MGANTFEQYQAGADVKQAFRDASEQAAYEHGHGGYTGTLAEKGDYVVITDTPLTMSEADVLIGKLLDGDDPRVSDKWGPAGAIPITSSTRDVTVKDFDYLHTHGYESRERNDAALLEAVQPLVKLKKGETIARVHLTSYKTPEVRGSYNSWGTAPRAARYKDCQAVVTINKPPTTRKVSLTVTIPGGLDYDTRRKEIQAQVDATMKVRAGEKVLSWHETGADTPGRAKVTAVAPKGATETRFICVMKDRAGGSQPVPRLGHGTWNEGFTTQAEARKWLTDVFNNEKNWVDNGPLRHLGDEVTVEVESVTRRADGQPLVAITRQVGRRTVGLEVEIKLANAATSPTPDGWMFFGWASS